MWTELTMLRKGHCPILGTGLDDQLLKVLAGIIDFPFSVRLKTFKMNNGTF